MFLFSISGSFLYLLGKPHSDQDNFSDKRLISNLIKETGNNCSLELTVFYENIRGTNIEVAIQNKAKAYRPIRNLVLQERNQTSHR